MSWEGWTIFALFWVVFVTTPGPNAVNCMTNGMTFGFRRSLWGVLAILCQSILFQLLSAAGVAALIVASPEVFYWFKLGGAGVLIWLGVRGWLAAKRPVVAVERPAGSIFWRGFAIATVNAKSVAGYLAAFTQFVQPDVPIWSQMWVIMPTALTITSLSYLAYTGLGAALGRAAIGMVFNTWLRRALAACFIVYGCLLGASATDFGRV